MNEDTNLDLILESLLQVFPIFHKKILRMDLGGVTGNLTRLHLVIMGVLSEGSITVTELARNSVATKSQMTHLIDQLVKLDVVERHPDEKDRRVINLTLTDNGRILLEDVKRKVKDHIKTTLARLTPEELAAMAGALETLRLIGAKL